jgi:hypothetical protein
LTCAQAEYHRALEEMKNRLRSDTDTYMAENLFLKNELKEREVGLKELKIQLLLEETLLMEYRWVG